MTIKANGRTALILATGFFLGLAGSSQTVSANSTTASAKPATVKHVWHHSKTYAYHRRGKAAVKPAAGKTDDVANADANATTLPTSVANANAELTSDVPGGNVKAMAARANDLVQAAPDTAATQVAEVVTPDQLNAVDRALQENQQPAAPVTTAQADPPAAPAPVAPVMAASRDNSTWDETSLIGKIFIAFGGLLTLASAARMFMA
jgi:hypothetical protein